jgi:hypothetical protein
LGTPKSPDFPPQEFTIRYEIGFHTDAEFLDITYEDWDQVYRPAENFIACNPYLFSWEIEDSAGSRFVITTDVPHLGVPPLIIYFKPDEVTRRIAVLSVQPVPETPDAPVTAS